MIDWVSFLEGHFFLCPFFDWEHQLEVTRSLFDLVGRSADEMVQRDFTEMVQADYDKAQRFFGDQFDSWVTTTNPQERATLVQSLEADIRLFQEYKYELDSGGWLAEQFNQLVNRTDMDGLAKAEERAALATLLGEYRQETVTEAIAYLTQPLQRNPDGSLVLGADGQVTGPGSAWYNTYSKPGWQYDPEQMGAILEVIGQTAEGAHLLRQVHAIEQQIPADQHRLLSVFYDDRGWASYDSQRNLLRAKLLLGEISPELAAPTFAHEFSHLLRRWEMGGTIQNEILSHMVEAQVLQSLQQQGRYPELNTLAGHPAYEDIARLMGQEQTTLNSLQDPYVDLTDYALIERGYHEGDMLKPKERGLTYEFPPNISDETQTMRELIDQTPGGLPDNEFRTQLFKLPLHVPAEEIEALTRYNQYRKYGAR